MDSWILLKCVHLHDMCDDQISPHYVTFYPRFICIGSYDDLNCLCDIFLIIFRPADEVYIHVQLTKAHKFQPKSTLLFVQLYSRSHRKHHVWIVVANKLSC